MMYAVWFMGYDGLAEVEEVYASEAEAQAQVEACEDYLSPDEACWVEEVGDDFVY